MLGCILLDYTDKNPITGTCWSCGSCKMLQAKQTQLRPCKLIIIIILPSPSISENDVRIISPRAVLVLGYRGILFGFVSNSSINCFLFPVTHLPAGTRVRPQQNEVVFDLKQ